MDIFPSGLVWLTYLQIVDKIPASLRRWAARRASLSIVNTRVIVYNTCVQLQVHHDGSASCRVVFCGLFLVKSAIPHERENHLHLWVDHPDRKSRQNNCPFGISLRNVHKIRPSGTNIWAILWISGASISRHFWKRHPMRVVNTVLNTSFTTKIPCEWLCR